MEKIIIPTIEKTEAKFHESIRGQNLAVHDFSLLLTDLRSGIKPDGKGPRASLFLAGPSGVGKTEITLTLAKLLAETNGEGNGAEKVIVVNGGEFQGGDSATRLIGSPPGYIGSKGDKGGYVNPIFSPENLKANKITYKRSDGTTDSVNIILIDEAEKANDDFHRLMLSVLDKGAIQMANNTRSDMTNTVVIFTSNLGNEAIEKSLEAGRVDIKDNEAKKEIVKNAIGNRFPPELRGRINQFVIFEHLTPIIIRDIAQKQLNEMLGRFSSSGIRFKLSIFDNALDWLAKKGYSPSEGARSMKKVITSEVYSNLMLINTATSLDGKDIAILTNEDEDKLDFYWTEAKQSTNNKLRPEVHVKKSVVNITTNDNNIKLGYDPEALVEIVKLAEKEDQSFRGVDGDIILSDKSMPGVEGVKTRIDLGQCGRGDIMPRAWIITDKVNLPDLETIMTKLIIMGVQVEKRETQRQNKPEITDTWLQITGNEGNTYKMGSANLIIGSDNDLRVRSFRPGDFGNKQMEEFLDITSKVWTIEREFILTNSQAI